ncbi:hypothetical protein NC653_009869 [Populus alba x Populus x berolinensis]|uniref:Uncharacterized protein n=1 Tax=Populus alba x Populus x berolinensis TaxID=444605 RepID=A0AAD6RA41_9ROSI|nr:hypothetical protein NC653_009869 [Populus alba x Populus x berolinensis]
MFLAIGSYVISVSILLPKIPQVIKGKGAIALSYEYKISETVFYVNVSSGVGLMVHCCETTGVLLDIEISLLKAYLLFL